MKRPCDVKIFRNAKKLKIEIVKPKNDNILQTNIINNLKKKFNRDILEKLPIYKYKNEIIEKIKQNQVVILSSTTGSGKTTQVPQYLYESDFAKNGIIGMTQPRVIAAISTAERISCERNTQLGQLVGYSVRFENVSSIKTKIKCLTDGILLREASYDKNLTAYSVIMLDEVHERSIHTEILIGVVTNAIINRQNTNNPLKLIVMSATLNINSFVNYYRMYNLTCEKFSIEEELYKQESLFTNRKISIASIVSEIVEKSEKNRSNVDHGILIFMPGEEEIREVVNQLKALSKRLVDQGLYGLAVFPLHSSLDKVQKNAALRPFVQDKTGGNKYRKVVVATNIAETSLTIPDIRIVIDSGLKKEMVYNSVTGLSSLKVVSTTLAECTQRQGRSSRLGDGSTIFNFFLQDLEKRKSFVESRLNNSNLSSILLSVLAMGYHDVVNFPWLEPPEMSKVEATLEDLLDIGAIVQSSDEEFTNTDLGNQLIKLPLDVPMAHCMLISASKRYNCLGEVIKLIAMLSVEEKLFVWMERNKNNQKIGGGDDVDSCGEDDDEFYYRSHQDTAKKSLREQLDLNLNLSQYTGDWRVLSAIYEQYEALKDNHMRAKFCSLNSLKQAEIMNARKIVQQLTQICKIQLGLHVAFGNFKHVMKCFVEAFPRNIATQIPKPRGADSSYQFRYQVDCIPDKKFLVKTRRARYYHESKQLFFLSSLETDRLYLTYPVEMNYIYIYQAELR